MHSRNVLLMIFHYFFANIFYVFPFVFLQPFLSVLGYDVVQRGILLSSCAIVAILSQFFVGYLCDKFKTNKKFYIGIIVIVLIATTALYSETDQNIYLHLIIVAAIGGLVRTLMVLQDAWCLEIDEYTKKYYGPIRGFGALGWVMASPVVALLISQYGYVSVIYSSLLSGSVLIIISLIVKDATKISVNKTISANNVRLLLSNRTYLIIIAILLSLNILDTANAYTVIDKMLLLNSGDQLISWRWTIQAFVELPIFLMGTKLLKRFGDYKLIMFSALMFSLKFLLFAIAQTPEQLILVTVLQSVSFPLLLISSKTLVDKVTPDTLKSSGQTIASSLSQGVALLLTPLLSGILINIMGIDYTLIVFSAFGVIAIIFGIRLTKRSEFKKDYK